MVRNVPQKDVRPGYTVVYPNRYKTSSKLMKLVVVVLMGITVGLMLLVTLGGWTKLQGLRWVNLFWAACFVLIAFYIFRWKRGLLPIVAGGGIILMMLALVAGTGAAGASWFDRSHIGYSSAKSIFGGSGFSDNILGLLTVLMAPVAIVLIVVAMKGFSQGWNVEQEVPEDEADRYKRGEDPRKDKGSSGSSSSEAATA
jgi:hypothetical protein